MVIFKNIIVILFIFILTNSCCDYRVTQMGGLRSGNYYKKYLNKRINPNLIGIDTSVLYKSIDYMHKETNNNIMEPITDPVLLDRTNFIKFYSNGNYYNLLKYDSVPLKKSFLNPKKGDIGFVIKRRENYFFMDYSTINCGGFLKNEFLIKRDTLIISAGSNKGDRIWYYYVKQKIPKEWLTFTPDNRIN